MPDSSPMPIFVTEDRRSTPLVYVAGPYTNPDPPVNVRVAGLAAEPLQQSGCIIAYVPHISMLWHLIAPHDLQHWYEYDLHLLGRCDAVLRLPGASTGADNEVEVAEELGLPVFHEEGDVIVWANRWIRGWRPGTGTNPVGWGQ
jgi:hypothetical protein